MNAKSMQKGYTRVRWQKSPLECRKYKSFISLWRSRPRLVLN